MKKYKIILGIVFILFALLTSCRMKSVSQENKTTKKDQNIPDSAVGFGYKFMWIAVKTREKERVADVLGLKDLTNCNWETGIDSAYGKGIFITPTIDGWTLVCGWGLAYSGIADIGNKKESFDTLKAHLKTLSEVFGEAQFFCTQRIAEYHCWIKALHGEIVREYCISGEIGEVILDEGESTDFEKGYYIAKTFSEQEEYYTRKGLKNVTVLDEDFVMKVARNWSIDPTQLDKRADLFGKFGLIGKE